MNGDQLEPMRMGEIFAVSRYWTPHHIDVTNLPTRYAPPKSPWIDKFAEHRRLHAIDASDRLARRRVHTHAIVEPAEIPILPALVFAPPAPSRAQVFVKGVRTALARRMTRPPREQPIDQAHPA
ncbi:MAG: hypothetical protein NVSMB5_21340 [Candidatus Velthaea sp.]